MNLTASVVKKQAWDASSGQNTNHPCVSCMLDLLLHFALHNLSDPERIRKARFSSGHAGLFWLDASKIG